MNNAKWHRYEKYISSEDDIFLQDAKVSLDKKRKFRNVFRDSPEIKDRLRKVSNDSLRESFSILSKGDVVGVDGTLSMYPTLVGYRCRIGVVAVNYLGKNIGEALYVSDLEFIDDDLADIVELFRNIEEFTRFSPLLYRSLMLYKERELALSRDEEWKMLHGPIVPLEMRLGRLGIRDVLEENIALAEKIVEYKKFIGVLSSTNKLRVLNLGYLLEPGEYMFISSADKFMRSEHRRLTREEESIIEDFLEVYGSKISVGIFRATNKAYVFEAYRDFFDNAASIIIADSLNNKMKGFPFLIDYADKLCSRLFSSEEFKSRFEQFMLITEGEDAFASFDERHMRWF